MSRAIVIGGGIGGLAAAIALRHSGVDVVVYERAAEMEETGAGLSLWANAIRALDRLGLGHIVASASTEYAVAGLRAWNGEGLATISMDELRSAFGVPVVIVHRAELLRALVASVEPSNLRLGRRCIRIHQDATTVSAEFESGERAEGDFLVGADGLHSVVRAALHGAHPPRYAGCTAWRSVVRVAIDVPATETWGYGSVFGQVPMGGGRVYWYATENVPEGERSGADEKRRLLDRFRGWHAPIESLIDAADEATILRNDIYDRPPLSHWGHGRVTLLGDAAHPMMPFLGQGGCQALEDAVVLGRTLRGAPAVAPALRAYEAGRIPRSNMFVRRSRAVGRIAQLENPVAVFLRNRLVGLANPRAQARQIARMIEVPGDAAI